MKHWTLDDIDWGKFDASKVTPELLSLAKAASMVEHNGYDYARYLCEVFNDDEEFKKTAMQWAEEEVQHGKALRKWAELADPKFDFEKSFRTFTAGIKLPENVTNSIRGSKSGELIARCVVETGTSIYYTALKEDTDEPVMKDLCGHIAADELRHYKMFYNYLKTYLVIENIGFFKRIRVAVGRLAESEDDELAYAFYAACNDNEGVAYDHKHFKTQMASYAYRFYRREHVERMTGMVFKAIGLKPQTMFGRAVNKLAWGFMNRRAIALRNYNHEPLAA